MNKEFMLLNYNTIEITNEEGKEINRGEFENNNVKGVLLSENKVEMIEKLEEILEKEKVTSNSLEPLVKVSLEKETNAMVTQIAEELKMYYEENLKQKGKVKIRKR